MIPAATVQHTQQQSRPLEVIGISYRYDLANRLAESVDVGTGIVTTYDWDDVGRLLTTTMGSNVTRISSAPHLFCM